MANKDKRERILRLMKEAFKERVDRMSMAEFLDLLKAGKSHEKQRETPDDSESDRKNSYDTRNRRKVITPWTFCLRMAGSP